MSWPLDFQGPDYEGIDPQHFEGHLDLTLRIIEPTDTIIMNALYLEISSVIVFDKDENEGFGRKNNILIINKQYLTPLAWHLKSLPWNKCQIKKPFLTWLIHNLKRFFWKPSQVEQLTPTFDLDLEQMTLKLSNPLVAGANYVLKFEYLGFLKNNNFGFYISEYEMDGKTRYVASSQMQGPYARSVKK